MTGSSVDRTGAVGSVSSPAGWSGVAEAKGRDAPEGDLIGEGGPGPEAPKLMPDRPPLLASGPMVVAVPFHEAVHALAEGSFGAVAGQRP